MNDFAAWFGIAISAGSLIVAIIALRKSASAQREANCAARRIVEIEEQREHDRKVEAKKAKLTVRGIGDTLRIENHGLALARELVILADGKPLQEHDRFGTSEAVLTKIGPGSHHDYPIVPYDGAPPIEIQVSWVDGSGEGGSCDGGAIQFC